MKFYLIIQRHVRTFLHRRRTCDVFVVVFVTLVEQRLDLIQQRLGSQSANVRLLEHQALVVQRLQVELLVLEKGSEDTLL